MPRTMDTPYKEGIDPDTGIDFDARYSVRGFRGIAFRLWGYSGEWQIPEWTDTDDDGNDVTYYGEEPEWVEDRSRVLAIMVGDDHRWTVEVDDLTPISEEDYCGSCGQIGCGWC